MAVQRATQINVPAERDIVKYRIESGSRYEFFTKRNIQSTAIYNDEYNINNPFRDSLLDTVGHNDMISNGYILYPSEYVGTGVYSQYVIDNFLQTKTHYSGFSDVITFDKSMCVFNPTANLYTGLIDTLTLRKSGNTCTIDGLPVRYTLGTSGYVDQSSVKILLASDYSTTGLRNAALDWDACYTEAMKYRSKFRSVYNYLLSLPYGAAYVHPYVVYIDDDPNKDEVYRNIYHPATETGTGPIDNIYYWSATKFILPFATENEFHISGCSNYINYEMISTNTKNQWQIISNYNP